MYKDGKYITTVFFILKLLPSVFWLNIKLKASNTGYENHNWLQVASFDTEKNNWSIRCWLIESIFKYMFISFNEHNN